MASVKISNLPAVTSLNGSELIPVVKDGGTQRASISQLTTASLDNFIAAGTGAGFRSAQDKMRDIVSVKDFVAVGDGVVDDTLSIQAAINATSAAGKTLHMPAGRYRVTAPLIPPNNTRIVGEDWPVADTSKGTWIWFDHTGVGFNCSTYTNNVDFSRLGTYRTQPSASVAPFTPTAHDWDFRLRGDDVHMTEIMLLNPTKGIVMLEGGRLTAENIRGEPLTTGLLVNSASDTMRVRNVHFWPYWSANSAAVRAWKTTNATSFYSKRNDNPKWENIFSFGYRYGLRFGYNDAAVSGFGVTGTTYLGLFSQVNLDYSIQAVYFDADCDGATVNFSQLAGVGNWPTADATNFALFETAGSNCKITLTASGLYEAGLELMKIGGTGNRIDINGFSSGGFAYVPPLTANALEAQAGNTINVAGYWNMEIDPGGSPRIPRYSSNVNVSATVYKSVAGNPSSPHFSFAGAIPLFTQRGPGADAAGFRVQQPGAREYKAVVPVSDTAYRFFDVTGGNLERYYCDAAGSHVFSGQSTVATTIRFVIDGAGFVRPGADNTQSMGTASFRWSEIYAGSAVINTSDANEKQQIENLSKAEMAVAKSIKGLIRRFKFNDSVAAKGANARIHVGVVAQEIAQAFIQQKLDPSKYAMFCRDEWWEIDGEVVQADKNGTVTIVRYDLKGARVFPDGNGEVPEGAIKSAETKQATKRERLGIRYDQLLAFVIAAL